MKYVVLIFSLFLFSEKSFCENYDLSHFKERFEIKLNETGEKVIIDKTLTKDLSMDRYIKNLATYLSVADTDPLEKNPDCKGWEYEKPNPEITKSFQKAFNWMKKTNIGKLMVNEKFLKFINDVEYVTLKYTSDPQFAVVANLDNPSYFYKKAFIKFLRNKLENLASAYFNSTVFLKAVTYVGDDYASFIVNKKIYHQNILSYYLEMIPPADLGLTESEVHRALTSIIDSRLSFGFGGYWEARKIKKDFEGYGFKKMQSSEEDSEKRLAKYSSLFEDRVTKINHNFSEVLYGSGLMTVDLGIKKEKFDDRPSLTFDGQCPEFLYQNRRIFESIRITLGMSPIPYSNKLFTIVKSKYQPQALNEGFYYGYLEATNQMDKKDYILRQSMNPLLDPVINSPTIK